MTTMNLDVHLKRHRSDIRMEVEEGGGTAAKPLRDVLRIRQGGAQCHDTNGLSDL